MDLRRIVGGIGRTLIGFGVLILLFVAYQLWGTNLAEARSQRALRRQFARQLAQGPPPTTPPTTTASPPPTVDPATLPPPAPEGDAVAIIKIPKLGLEKVVVQGVTLDDLKKGPGHYPQTPLPGQPGNAAIAGHRTTYGAPFFHLDDLGRGDPILVTTRQGRFRYEVRESKVVGPDEISVLRPGAENSLTLTTCNPRFSASERLVVVASLTGPATPPPPPPPPTPGGPAVPARSKPVARPGLSGGRAARGPAVGWGLAALSVWLLTVALSRAWRRWPAYVLGTPVFLVVLFVFFENFSRLLPANY